MENMASGLLATGLKSSDRVLIAGYNHSQVLISALAASRAGFVFSLASPNFLNAEQLKHLLVLVNIYLKKKFKTCRKIN